MARSLIQYRALSIPSHGRRWNSTASLRTRDCQRKSIVLTRDQGIALQVWSAELGYPGDPNYLDFHKKHFSSALRYWRVTDAKADMRYKLLYVPEWAHQRAQLHAFHFTQLVERSLAEYRRTTGRRGIVCLPFDTELFGHWWFEGPVFLYHVLRGLSLSPIARPMTASAAIEMAPPREIVRLPEGSWGRGNHHDVWIEPSVHWMWEALYRAEWRWMRLAERCAAQHRTPTLERLLAQALRELLLLQASDWEFLVTTGLGARLRRDALFLPSRRLRAALHVGRTLFAQTRIGQERPRIPRRDRSAQRSLQPARVRFVDECNEPCARSCDCTVSCCSAVCSHCC